jgi:hypothetical protein
VDSRTGIVCLGEEDTVGGIAEASPAQNGLHEQVRIGCHSAIVNTIGRVSTISQNGSDDMGSMSVLILGTIGATTASVRNNSGNSANEVCMDAAVHRVAMGQARAFNCSI